MNESETIQVMLYCKDNTGKLWEVFAEIYPDLLNEQGKLRAHVEHQCGVKVVTAVLALIVDNTGQEVA